MDTKAYIESGIIESCVLGLATTEDAAELELLCRQHADIKQAVEAFELLIEKQAFENAVTPPADIRNKLMAALANEFANENENDKIIAPVIAMKDDNTSGADDNKTKRIGFWKYMAAASVILLVASAALNFYLYNNYQSASTKYQALLTQRNSLQANNDVFHTKLNDFEESMRIIQNPDMRVVKLEPTTGKENNLATVYWDTKTKDVYIIPSKLDPAPAGRQYQLWAIVDGKPVDAGLIKDCNGVCKMTNTPRAQKFAITLEQKGGSPTPHLDQLYVISQDI